jgi:hypothetical protein
LVKPKTPGELNWGFSVLIKGYLSGRPLSYQLVNDVTGALIGQLLEFYARVARGYEDEKREENGDVYDSEV